MNLSFSKIFHPGGDKKAFLFLLLPFCAPVIASAQNLLTGTVLDESGEPVVAATINVDGTQRYATTDIDGSYTIDGLQEGDLLIFDFLGKKTEKVAYKGQRTVNVTLYDDMTVLEDVVVVGYGRQRKVSVVGAQSTMRAADIKTPTGNLSSAISGRIAGGVSVQRSGEPGHDDSDIWIRGISTFTGQSSSPLILPFKRASYSVANSGWRIKMSWASKPPIKAQRR